MAKTNHDKAYIRGELTEPEAPEHHRASPKIAVGVYATLVTLVGLMTLLAQVPLANVGLPLVMSLAVFGALLILGFFMDLQHGARFYSVVFFGALFFAALFILLPCLDWSNRGALDPQWGNDRLIEDRGLNVAPEPIADPSYSGEGGITVDPEGEGS